jgi:hypothetical protein
MEYQAHEQEIHFRQFFSIYSIRSWRIFSNFSRNWVIPNWISGNYDTKSWAINLRSEKLYLRHELQKGANSQKNGTDHWEKGKFLESSKIGLKFENPEIEKSRIAGWNVKVEILA